MNPNLPIGLRHTNKYPQGDGVKCDAVMSEVSMPQFTDTLRNLLSL